MNGKASAQGDFTAMAPEDVQAIPPVAPPAAWDKEADIVVVGLGGGVLAAAKAAELGCSVIAIDKTADVGGTTKQAGALNVFGARKVGRHPAAPPFDLEAAVQKAVVDSRFTVNEALARATIVKCGEMVDWLADLGVEWTVNTGGGVMYSPHIEGDPDHKGHWALRGAIDPAHALFRKHGGETLLNTQVVALVKDQGRIVGVKTTHLPDGTTRFIKARRAVILAAGGFSHNKAMLKKYVPTAYKGVGSVSMAMPSNTGECIRMGLGVGADISGYDTFTGFDGGIDFSDVGGPWFRYLYSGDIQLARNPWLHVNMACERFTFVDSSPRQFFTRPAAIMAQPGNRAYVIFDDNYESNVWKFNPVGCKTPITPDLPLIEDWCNGKAFSPDWRDGVKEAMDMGAIKSADTIEALAEQLGLEPARLKQAVDTWNGHCAAGVDPEFGEPPEYLIPVLKAPFHGAKIGSSMASTACGLRVNPHMQVLDEEQNVIPGLYATFFTAGGGTGEVIFGNPAVLCAGGSMTTGYMAGEHAAKQTRQE